MTDEQTVAPPIGFGFTFEEQKAELEKRRLERRTTRKDGRICKCGHPARCHTSENHDSAVHQDLRDAKQNMCVVGKQICPCRQFQAVASTSDIRYFYHKTAGPAALHALALGWLSAVEAGKEIDWLPGVVCDGCKAGGKILNPLALRGLYEALEPTDANVLFCNECRIRASEVAGS